MKTLFFSLLTTVSQVSTAQTQVAPLPLTPPEITYETRTEQSQFNPFYRILAYFGDSTADQMGVYWRYSKISYRELVQISAASFREAQRLCQSPYEIPEDDEADAIRHFVAAGILAGRQGMGVASTFLTARENGPRVSVREKMDLYNNQLGLAEGAKLFNQQKSVEDLSKILARKASQYLEAGKLSVLSTPQRQDYKCRRKRLYPNTLHEAIAYEDFFLIKGKIPATCSVPKKSVCADRSTSKNLAFCLYRRERVRISEACRKDLRNLFNFDKDRPRPATKTIPAESVR